jgi:hypothetical protein
VELCTQCDAFEWLSGLPDDCADLLFTSPPYEGARTYGLPALPEGEAWVKWMRELVEVASPKVRGLIAINCEGTTSDFDYSATPFLLVADLKRAGFTLRKPPVFQRNGIPGSGGPDWLRNDWEPVICVTRGGRLPWADPLACGAPPKYAHSGGMTSRKRDGTRDDRGNMAVPEIANPGNVIRCAVGHGHMGHPLAHDNEAPFPLALAEFFVRSFCPPDGLVIDCFSGSGTTMHAAIATGRRFAGCDIRLSQVELTRKRFQFVQPCLF